MMCGIDNITPVNNVKRVDNVTPVDNETCVDNITRVARSFGG